MSKNMTELAGKYEELIEMADKMQSRQTLSPASLQLLASLLARISMIELQLFGQTNIYSGSRRKIQTQDEDAPF